MAPLFNSLATAPKSLATRFSGWGRYPRTPKTRVGPENAVSKAQSPVLDAADRNRPKMERAFTELVEAVRRQIPLNQMEERLRERDLNGLLALMDVEQRMKAVAEGRGLLPGATSLLDALQQTFLAGAQAEVLELDKIPVEKGVGAAMAFDLLNPQAMAFLSSYTFRLIREVSQDQRLAVQDIVLEAFRSGGHPYEQARDIRRMVGLTRQQARAAQNFRHMLQGSPDQMRQALTRALRDRRFDSTVLRAVNTGTGLRRDQVDAMVERFYRRYLDYRARNIARTETMRAAHAGQRETRRQAREQGLLPADRTRQVWIVSRDERLCPRCAPVPGLNPDGVPLDEMFQTPDGPVEGPPLHPSCRCTTGVKILREWRGEL